MGKWWQDAGRIPIDPVTANEIESFCRGQFSKKAIFGGMPKGWVVLIYRFNKIALKRR